MGGKQNRVGPTYPPPVDPAPYPSQSTLPRNSADAPSSMLKPALKRTDEPTVAKAKTHDCKFVGKVFWCKCFLGPEHKLPQVWFHTVP